MDIDNIKVERGPGDWLLVRIVAVLMVGAAILGIESLTDSHPTAPPPVCHSHIQSVGCYR